LKDKELQERLENVARNINSLLTEIEEIKDALFSPFIDAEDNYTTTMVENVEKNMIIAYQDLIQMLTEASAEGILVKHYPGYYGIDDTWEFMKDGQKIEVLLCLKPGSGFHSWYCTRILDQGYDYCLEDYPDNALEGLRVRVKYPRYPTHKSCLL
jgi:hypothetical protein